MRLREDYIRGDIYRQDGVLFLDGVSLEELAKEWDTPLYVYSARRLRENFLAYKEAFSFIETKICYAVKANNSLAILRELASLGAGADIVSGGELYLALKAGIKPEKIVFAGVGKTDQEIKEALLAGVFLFNVESIQELERINFLAGKIGEKARIAFRVNPDIDPISHPKISTGLKESKFGISKDLAIKAYKQAASMENIEIGGVHFHIGSQITNLGPFELTAEAAFSLAEELAKESIKLEYINIGGGLGIDYENTGVPKPVEISNIMKKYFQGTDYKLILEPGRSIVGNAGYLLSEIIYIKKQEEKNFVILDAGLNDLVRPAMYGSYHEILPLSEEGEELTSDIVGPICEAGDIFASDRKLAGIKRRNKVLICDAGAYGFSMASNYNARPRPAEVLIDGGKTSLIRKRETYADLMEREL
ncbi:MAG: diaminopimelate decarboxylase [Elusimicrobia bacterium]|nr:diaminopimelate decarboxylase [Elusimicrobiota bacterium]